MQYQKIEKFTNSEFIPVKFKKALLINCAIAFYNYFCAIIFLK